MSGKSDNVQVIGDEAVSDQSDAVAAVSDTPVESGSGGATTGVVADPRWHVEGYLERCGVTLVGRRLKAMVIDSSSPFIYDRNRICHDTCVGAWRRRRDFFARNRSMTLTKAPLADVPFVCCEEEAAY